MKDIKRFCLIFASVLILFSLGMLISHSGGDEDIRIYNEIYAGIESFSEYIEIPPGVTAEKLSEVFSRLFNNSPELFFISPDYTFAYDSKSMEVTKLFPEYLMPKADADNAREYIDMRIDQMLDGIDADDEFYASLYLHDLLCAEFEYAEGGAYDIYTFLRTGRGVCQAYTGLYTLLLRRVGIESCAVCSSGMDHIWNRVKINGAWYNIDVTWDDASPDEYGRALHSFFLKSDSYFANNRHYGWVVDQPCVSGRYDRAWFNGINSRIYYLDGAFYFVDNSPGCRKLQAYREEKITDICAIPGIWQGEDGRKLTRSFSGIGLFDGGVVFNSPDKICLYCPDSREVCQLYYAQVGEIYGFVQRGNKLTLDLGSGVFFEQILRFGSFLRGDADGDGTVDIRDVCTLSRYLSEKSDQIDFSAVDMDGDGDIDADDYGYMRYYVADLYFRALQKNPN